MLRIDHGGIDKPLVKVLMGFIHLVGCTLCFTGGKFLMVESADDEFIQRIGIGQLFMNDVFFRILKSYSFFLLLDNILYLLKHELLVICDLCLTGFEIMKCFCDMLLVLGKLLR